MGGFFITNSAAAAASATQVFSTKPVGERQARTISDLNVQHWGKQVATIAPAVHETPEGWLIGCGAFFRGGKFGAACLAELWVELAQGFNVFAEVGGHFAFIVYRNGKLNVVTDKSGTYLVYVARAADHFFISTSLLAIAACLPQLTLGRQEVLEFVNTETTLGQKTLFEEIEHANAGSVISCTTKLDQVKYYEPRDEPVSFSQLTERCRAYFEAFRTPEGSLGCDLSGGKDSRTVAALLTHFQISAQFNTNRNTLDPTDHAVAERVAAFLGQPIVMHENRTTEYDYAKLVADCFSALDVGRNMYRSAFQPIYFSEKSQANSIVLGGYGGELLRDKYSLPKSIDQLIRKHYVASTIWMPSRVYADYRARLADKFKRTLTGLGGEADIKKASEKIYLFEKMRFWGGNHISAFNQYCYRVHPLLDHTLAKHYFDFSIAEKTDVKLQKHIISVVPGLDQVPFADRFDKVDPLRSPVRWLRLEAHRRAKLLSPELMRLKHRMRTRGRFIPPERLREATSSISPELQTFLSISLSNIPHGDLIGRLATVAYTINHFGSKVRGF